MILKIGKLSSCLALALLTGCASLPVSATYIGSSTYNALIEVPPQWLSYSSAQISPNNPSPPLFLEGFGISLDNVMIPQAGNTVGGTILVRSYGSREEALSMLDNMFILDFKKQVENGSVAVIKEVRTPPEKLKQERFLIMDVSLSDGTVSRVMSSTVLYRKETLLNNQVISQYILRSLSVGCYVACYNEQSEVISKIHQSWESNK